MRESTRRRILADMGIVEWRLRAAPGAAPAAAPAAGEVTAAGDQQEPAAAIDSGESEAPAAAVPAVQESSPGETWSVLSLCAPGVVLVIDAASPRRDLRLARDVLAAASGDWTVKPLRRRFDWPPGGVTTGAAGDADAARRALAAFIDKDADDHEAELVICAGTLVEALPRSPSRWRLLAIPELQVLGRDVEAKRRLWRELAGTGA